MSPLITAEDWAPYGVGVPDEDGWYPDYRGVPDGARPSPPTTATTAGRVHVVWTTDLLDRWGLIVADLAALYGVDLTDPQTRARPWPGVRLYVHALLDHPRSRLRGDLTEE